MELEKRSLEPAIMEELIKDEEYVTVLLNNGFQMRGVITGHDSLVIVLFCDGKQNIIYKHSISYITPMRLLRAGQPKTNH